MKFFITIVVFVCLAFPAFSQDVALQRYNSLNDAIENAHSRSINTLATYDSRISENDDDRVYASFRIRFESITQAMRDSEARMSQLFRSNSRPESIKNERDNYESLVRQLESVRSEYTNWVRSVR